VRRHSSLFAPIRLPDVFASFTISPGEMFHVAVGSLHTIENIGDCDAELITLIGHERPEDFSLHAASVR